LQLISIDRADAGDITEALRTVHEMEAGFEKDTALLGIAASQARMGDVRGAVKATSQIQSERSKGDALYQIAKIAARQDGPARDFRWAAKSKDPFQRASVLLGLAEGMMAVTAIEDSK
jgi:hypothetical protein